MFKLKVLFCTLCEIGFKDSSLLFQERLGLSELRKQANRMNFGQIEEDAYQDDLGFSMGTMGKSSSGKIRGAPVDAKTKARISKTLQQKLSKQNQTWGGSTTVKKQVGNSYFK